MGNQDIRWILDTLKTSMRLLEITNREVETRMEWSHGYLSRIFSGTIELRVEHVVEIVAILITAGDGEDAFKTRNADFQKVRRSSGIGDRDPGSIRFVCDG